MSMDMVPHGVHMVHAWMMKIKSRVEGIMSEHIYTVKFTNSRLSFSLFHFPFLFSFHFIFLFFYF